MNQRVVVCFVGVLLLAAFVGMCVSFSHFAPASLFDFYAKNLRASLFSGCLTLGSFLLAVNTFLVVNLKKEVFDHALYKKRVDEHRKNDPNYPFFQPLRNLGRVLLVTIAASFIAAILQLTAGVLSESKASAAICISAAIAVGVLVLITLSMVAITMHDWFNFLDEAAMPEPPLVDDSTTAV